MVMIKNNDLKLKLALMALAFCFALTLSVLLNLSVGASAAASSTAAAGSADDPLVTLGYINKVFTPQLSQTIDKAIADKLKSVNDKLNTLSATVASLSSSASSSPSGSSGSSGQKENQPPPVQNIYVMPDAASTSYVALELTKGQKLRVKEGTLELILRPGGTAVVISDYKTQGIADLTTGNELLDGKSLPINHSLFIPRADGRGIKITSVIAYVMVRGDYEIFE